MQNLPTYLPVIFGITTLATLFLFIWTIRNSNTEKVRRNTILIALCLSIWLVVQTILPLNNFYNKNTNVFPPIIVLMGVFPTIITIILLFLFSKGRQFIDSLPIKNLTILNIVRIPVEIVLYWLFINKVIPEIMTFQGLNFDILAGISALFMSFIAFKNQKVNKSLLLIWNIFCLLLLINIVIIALLSAPSPIQKLALDQPNIAILYFPYSWLPTFIVPIVLFGHLVSIRQLIKKA